MGDYTISDVYQGGYSSFDPKVNLSPVDNPVPASSIGMTTDARSANILKSLSDSLSKGLKTIEVGAISPAVFESIPQDQLKEVNRLSKLTGVDVTVHAPVVEASGITQQGFSETSRAAIERQMNHFVETSHKINPDGSSPVTFHSSAGIIGDIQDKGKEPESVIVIDRESGSWGRIPIRKSDFGNEKDEKVDIDVEVAKINEKRWNEDIRGVQYYKNIWDREFKRHETLARLGQQDKIDGKVVTDSEKQANEAYKAGISFIESSYNSLSDLFDTAVKNVPEHEKKKLEDFREEINPIVEQIKTAHLMKDTLKEIRLKEDLITRGIDVLREVRPQTYQPLSDFAKDKTTETFANVALHSYDEYKDKAPIISIENPPAGGAFSTGEELKKVVEESRDKFVKKAILPKSKGGLGMGEIQARKQAEKLLGVTWDVGHINMLRKFGYDDKDIVKESEQIAPLLKHVHLSDNFGFEHTELPMGMGNVPMKQHMEKLGKKGIEAKKIIEAISWYEHFKTPAVTQTLEAFGSPIYSMKMEPYWNQAGGFQQGYSSGYGQMLPPQHFQTYGTGFTSSTLPTELGGQMPGAGGSRMSGRPME